MNTSEPKKPNFIDGFYDSFSSGFCRDCGHTSSASCISPRHASRDACVGYSLRPPVDHCLFASGSTCSSSRVSLLRRSSKGVSSSSHFNRYLPHANPRDNLSAFFTPVAKSWVPKFMLAFPQKQSPCLLILQDPRLACLFYNVRYEDAGWRT